MQYTYRIWGWSVVFDDEENHVSDCIVLEELSHFVDDEDLYATDFMGGTPLEDTLAEALERSGQLRFEFRPNEPLLRINTDFVANRRLSANELEWLKADTLGQWSDGMGECLFVPRGPFKGYKLQPLDSSEVDETDYPFVEVRNNKFEIS
jgi:hypothetical protein